MCSLSPFKGFELLIILWKNNLNKSMPGTNIRITISSEVIFVLLLYALIKSAPNINGKKNDPLLPKKVWDL